MEIITNKKKKYTYLFTDKEKKMFYFDKQSKKCYFLQRENNEKVMSKVMSFSGVFSTSLSLILAKPIIGDTKFNFFISCLIGIPFGCLFLYFFHRSNSSRQLKEICLSLQDLEYSLKNLKKVAKVKIVLLLIWILCFIVLTYAFFSEEKYKYLLAVNFLWWLLPFLLENLNFIQHKRVTKKIKQLILEKEKKINLKISSKYILEKCNH